MSTQRPSADTPPLQKPSKEPESEEEEEEDDEEEEPKLKYQRLGASVSEILKRDVASCFATHEKFLVTIFFFQHRLCYLLDCSYICITQNFCV
jgi:hypothetical protein